MLLSDHKMQSVPGSSDTREISAGDSPVIVEFGRDSKSNLAALILHPDRAFILTQSVAGYKTLS